MFIPVYVRIRTINDGIVLQSIVVYSSGLLFTTNSILDVRRCSEENEIIMR